MLLYYKLGCLYFGGDDYENAIIYLNKIVQNKGLKCVGFIVFCPCSQLVAHYEAALIIIDSI